MLYLIVFFLLITNIYASCTNQTCNHGQCLANRCHCDPGVQGERCDADIIDCDRNSCLNNGVCMELINGFVCQCSANYYGSRCQYHRKSDDKSCQKQCLNQGKCILTNNQEKCFCSTNYFGSLCEYQVNQSSTVEKCPVLRFKNNEKSGTCLAIGLTPPVEGSCECRHTKENRHLIHCLLVPGVSSTQKCFFKTSLRTSLATTLTHAISVPVCPINWQMLEQYQNQQEIVRNVRSTRCQFI